ncbi:16S rRNA (cytosine(1402)-N(4))-methyltransferase RsmH [Roseospira marina]|uniref:Ribosomal RNA small subunit methyltransferase H n=1 Tax=Roseospira marina TaxID=140057 RepID=A0A5M6I9C1_9PROT|nr:16S rRNA (cytosine(1402)-N(4))-methyltransferase RsmH [Roseospira marina]KAA5604567.1 16S rRNA (cytosine(1402)-N(4))-methyltransferase RsmH [Roseospira marina]MBB4315314.1 16S rRNA (cytosine1402-N4)-methyltransferase [Roseospira marina]MBB5088313.1 16S rRNA (cytosine1402-N4)-methyltransferase [Roseospira marina]
MSVLDPALSHVPVMGAEVVDALAVRDGGVYVDGTFGAGGYSRAILAAAPTCVVWAVDRDPVVAHFADALAAEHPGRFRLVPGCFGAMDRLLAAEGVAGVDGVALDLGVSSLQIDDAARGFSFQQDGPLDMRMGRDGSSAADLVNTADEAELVDIIASLGEERHARRVARAIAQARAEAPIVRTGKLAEVVRAAIPGAARQQARDGIDPATRTFQALRLHVNDELGELDTGLEAAERLLGPGGRLVVVSFHSLEDRRVKSFMRARTGDRPAPSRHQPVASNDQPRATFRAVGRKAVRPGDAEVSANARARSARMRVAERTDAPAWDRTTGGEP